MHTNRKRRTVRMTELTGPVDHCGKPAAENECLLDLLPNNLKIKTLALNERVKCADSRVMQMSSTKNTPRMFLYLWRFLAA